MKLLLLLFFLLFLLLFFTSLVQASRGPPKPSPNYEFLAAAPSRGSDPALNFTAFTRRNANGTVLNAFLATVGNPIGHFHVYVALDRHAPCGGTIPCTLHLAPGSFSTFFYGICRPAVLFPRAHINPFSLHITLNIILSYVYINGDCSEGESGRQRILERASTSLSCIISFFLLSEKLRAKFPSWILLQRK